MQKIDHILNLQETTVCISLKVSPSPENCTQLLVLRVLTFCRSAAVMVMNFMVVVGLQWSVVVVIVVIVEMLELVVDFREAMMTSPPEL